MGTSSAGAMVRQRSRRSRFAAGRSTGPAGVVERRVSHWQDNRRVIGVRAAIAADTESRRESAGRAYGDISGASTRRVVSSKHRGVPVPAMAPRTHARRGRRSPAGHAGGQGGLLTRNDRHRLVRPSLPRVRHPIGARHPWSRVIRRVRYGSLPETNATIRSGLLSSSRNWLQK